MGQGLPSSFPRSPPCPVSLRGGVPHLPPPPAPGQAGQSGAQPCAFWRCRDQEETPSLSGRSRLGLPSLGQKHSDIAMGPRGVCVSVWWCHTEAARAAESVAPPPRKGLRDHVPPSAAGRAARLCSQTLKQIHISSPKMWARAQKELQRVS